MYKKVLLINPPESSQDGFSNPPLGLLYLASALRSIGAEVKLYDGYVEGWEGLSQALFDFNPDAVCITCLTPRRHEALKAARACKFYDHTIVVIMGGVHPSLMWLQVLTNYPEVDIAVIGEGEETIKELIRNEKPLHEVTGIAYRFENVAVKTPIRKYIENLDDIAYPAWDLIDLSKYPARGDGIYNGVDISKAPRVSVIFSRGCVGHCNFCSTFKVWHGYRHRSPENMVAEIQFLYSKGVRHFCLADDCLTVDKEAIIQLCKLIVERDLKIAFFATTRSDLITPRLLHWMKKAGCYEISFGIETASPDILTEMGKDNNIDNNLKAIQMTQDAGMKATALLIVGNVGETESTIQQTIDFLKKAKPDGIGVVGGLWILPGTQLYSHCKNEGFISDSFWLGPEPYMVYTKEHSLEKLEAWRKQVIDYDLNAFIKNRVMAIKGKIRSMI
jgi:radical SAM superfamily enzyme YgiQ (UPF0313 family)